MKVTSSGPDATLKFRPMEPAPDTTHSTGKTRDLKSFQYFEILLSVFLAVLLVSNLVGQKICSFGPFHLFGASFGPFVLGGAQLLFPITYIFGDIFTEVYGYAASRRAIWLGFLSSALLSAMSLLMVALPPAPGWPDQEAYAKVFGFVPRMMIASLIAYWCGEFTNSFTLAKMKVLTNGKHLWSRTISSTVVGQLVDTAVFLTLAFGSKLDAATIVQLIVNSYLFKVAYEALSTPVTYAIVKALKKAEGVDTFDVNTDFSPFKKVLQS